MADVNTAAVPVTDIDEKKAPSIHESIHPVQTIDDDDESPANQKWLPRTVKPLADKWEKAVAKLPNAVRGAFVAPPYDVAEAYWQDRTPPPAPGPKTVLNKLWTFCTFLGPGAIISVAYIDPDNYQTNIASGASFQYKLLFMVLLSNLIAIYIQALSCKLGSVTGMDLAQMNRRYLPRWLDLLIYVIAEASIICTDLGQVIGFAIAMTCLIPRLPLAAAVVLSVTDTMLILFFYDPQGKLRRIRLFEIFVGCLVIVVFVTICIALHMVSAPARDVFKGFLPSRDIFVSDGLYESCALLGGTLMPHTFYLGSALSKARLYDYDHKSDIAPRTASPASSTEWLAYRPSFGAVKACYNYSIAELCVTLGVVSIFTNSALVVISGAAFYNGDPNTVNIASNGDIYDLYNLFRQIVAPAAGVVFAVSLLFSGISAGIAATIAGQVVMEGALRIRISPFLRRLLTRTIAIIPALIIAVSVGRVGMANALIACNYILSIALLFVSFPLVWYTCFDKYMKIPSEDYTGHISMKNNIVTASVAWLLWLLVAVMDIASVVLAGLGIGN